MNCPICGSPQVCPYKIVNSVQILQCRKCFLAFVDVNTPRKKTDHIYEFTDYKKRETQFQKRYVNTLFLIKKYAHGKSILEVGAGFGLLSSILAKNGYIVDAIEPEVLPQYIKNTSVHFIKKTFESFALKPEKKYDAIILYDVLEHVDNPKKSVILFQKLLKKNGIVFIQTPNYLSAMALMVKNWSWWMVEDHRFFFSKDSLSHLFSKKIWKKQFYSTHEDLVDFKKNLDGNFGTNKLKKYLFFLWWIPYYFFSKHIIWFIGKGGLITTIYQKK